MSWDGFTDFKQECVTNWTKLFATNEVQFTDNAIDTFLAFVDHMSCSADTYVSLGGSNGCADQLTNWDGTQKVGLGAVLRKKPKGFLTKKSEQYSNDYTQFIYRSYTRNISCL